MKRLLIGFVSGGAVVGCAWAIAWFGIGHSPAAAIGQVPMHDNPASDSSAVARIQELEVIIKGQAQELASLTEANEQLRRRPAEQPAVEPILDELRVETDKDGNVLAKGMVRAGLRVGVWELWWPNGQMQANGPYLEGKRSGGWKTWSLDGTYKGTGKYWDDLREGVWTYTDKDGAMQDFELHLGEPIN